jgi:hypothetical protein
MTLKWSKAEARPGMAVGLEDITGIFVTVTIELAELISTITRLNLEILARRLQWN